MNKKIKRAAVKKAYQIMKEKGTTIMDLEQAAAAIIILFPSMGTELNDIIYTALERFNKFNN